jgi:hypothetical protein
VTTLASPANLLRRPYLSFEVAEPRVGDLPTRARARLAAPRLDRALAGGVDPSATPELAARAAWLGRRRNRCALAGALERAVGEARSTRRHVTSRVPIASRDVRANAGELLGLAQALRAERVAPAGVAAVQTLLCDALSPLYHPAAPGALRQAVLDARDALVQKET